MTYKNSNYDVDTIRMMNRIQHCTDEHNKLMGTIENNTYDHFDIDTEKYLKEIERIIKQWRKKNEGR